MKINLQTALQYIGNAKFCTPEEAIAYAKDFKNDRPWEDPGLWKIIFHRTDISPEHALTYAQELKNNYVFSTIMNREDIAEYLHKLSPQKALAYAQTASNTDIWKAVLKRIDITPQEALFCAVESKDSTVLKQILNRSDISAKQAITYAEEKGRYLWESVLNREDVLEYLKKLSPEEAIKYARKQDDSDLWEVVLARPDIVPKKVLTWVKYAGHKVFEYILTRNDVLEYLKKLSPEEAVAYAHKAQYYKIWQMVLSRLDVSAQEAIEHAKKCNHIDIWKKVLERNDITPQEAILCAKKVADDDLMKPVLDRNLVKKYINKLSPQKIIAYAEEINDWTFSEEVLGRTNVIEYLKSIPIEKALACAKKRSNFRIWYIVLDRSDIPPQEIISYVKTTANAEYALHNQSLLTYLEGK